MANRLGQTPWQTVGPFFHNALPWRGCDDLAPGRSDTISVSGLVLDGEGQGVADALLELWQADLAASTPEGLQGGFGRACTDETGLFAFRTLKPEAGPAPNASHIVVGVLGRGLLRRLCTRIYFEGDAGLEQDPVLASVPTARRPTLQARLTSPGHWRFDIVLKGPGETVFFDV